MRIEQIMRAARLGSALFVLGAAPTALAATPTNYLELQGDTDFDGDVDIDDLMFVYNRSLSSNTYWMPNQGDVNRDGTVDGDDVSIVGASFGDSISMSNAVGPGGVFTSSLGSHTDLPNGNREWPITLEDLDNNYKVIAKQSKLTWEADSNATMSVKPTVTMASRNDGFDLTINYSYTAGWGIQQRLRSGSCALRQGSMLEQHGRIVTFGSEAPHSIDQIQMGR